MKMKTEINASELALILDIPVGHARGKIEYCLLQASGDKNPSISIELYNEKHKIDLRPYLDDIWNNFLNRSQTRGWAINYPMGKIWHGTDKPIPRKVSLPRSLSSLISPEVKSELKKIWIERYSGKTKEEIIFEP